MGRWFLRMSRWARNPPSEQRFWLVLGIVAASLTIFAVEWMGWWPDWATAQRLRR